MRKIAVSVALIATLIYLTTSAHAPSHEAKAQPAVTNPVDAVKQETAYVERMDKQDGQWKMTIDPIDWYEGDAATKIFREREPDPEVTEPPDGYYIVNDDLTQQTITLADNVAVLMQIYDHENADEGATVVPDEPITIEKYSELIGSTKEDGIHIKDFPYHLTIENGKVVKIVQQYVP
ncbi:conserved hypothetical protein [Paenibacillus curdlanolyticus YK9]|uniref:Uncharacterized protein n=1 Tax=Paenibacillus curdlanolyticus YK9 TaxID=717606 RepID=E0I670_9BACL|nr:hypothetical protein [Paenibacillus curdlanolyticus]EFM12462.1 conserved hypothetical protein [Paenibacillus curdlanolyticus YK9]